MTMARRTRDRMNSRLLQMFVFSILVIPGGCSSRFPEPTCETVEQVAKFGIDYERTMQHALKDDFALRRFFLCSKMVDAAGAETYSGDVTAVLRAIGEERFLRVLQSMGNRLSDEAGDRGIEDEVLSQLRYDRGFGSGYYKGVLEEWLRFQQEYPKLSELIHPPPLFDDEEVDADD